MAIPNQLGPEESAAAENSSCFVVKHTFLDYVDTAPAANGGGEMRRACSDPALYEHNFAKDLFSRAEDSEDQRVDFDLTGLDGLLDDCEETDGPTELGEEAALLRLGEIDLNLGPSVTCSTAPSDREAELIQDITSEKSLELFKKTPVWLHSHSGSSSPREPAAAQPPSDFDRLLSENNRLALENRLLKENRRLAEENQQLAKLAEANNAAAAQRKSSKERPMEQSAMLAPTMQQPNVATWWAPPQVTTSLSQLQQSLVPMSDVAFSDGTQQSLWASSPSVPRRAAATAPQIDCEIPEAERTTVMWRNLPNNYSRAMLIALLDGEGFSGMYDFLYLPIDFKSRACLGYAFINLVSPTVVPAFWNRFHGYSSWILPSRKVSSVTWSGPHQGCESHVARYRNSPVMHDTVPDEYKPVVFTNGVRMAFPLATKQPRAPRVRNCPNSTNRN